MTRLVIVGAPGAGKSSVGQRVAKSMGVEFIDTDRQIEEQAGKPVGDIFVSDGEAAFRAMEAQAVIEAIKTDGAVVSLGGGAVLDPSTRAALADQPVVWLQVSLADATKRVGLGTARPLLLGNVRGTLLRLLDERTPLYEEVATWTVDTDGRSLDEVAADVMAIVAGVS
ncbi:MAG: shikimate kinase [Candidatus Nanopelagicales bacterium]